MEDKRFIKSIRIRNLLSFGPESEEIELRPLNVLIGPNGSGKSNFIEAISVLQAAPRDISFPMSEGGGAKEWMWKGVKSEIKPSIDTVFFNPFDIDRITVRHRISLGVEFDRLIIENEVVSPESPLDDIDFFFKYSDGIVKTRPNKHGLVSLGQIANRIQFNKSQSVFSQFRDPSSYLEITDLSYSLESIKIFRTYSTGINSVIRIPQKTDLPVDFLWESLSNFALLVNDLKNNRDTKNIFFDKMRLFYPRFEDFRPIISGGIIQLLVYESGLKDPIPAARLSDGTLRYLCLLLILCHPSPPPLICIEEPEIGLHPDILPTIAELLVEASKRTQLIVTTHSDILVSALSEQPESILVCEHDERGTSMRRLDQEKLHDWLKKYSLGDLWLSGHIGGTRW
jgi:predicted ATPase